MASPGNCRTSTVLAHFLEGINTPRMVPFDTQDFLLVFYIVALGLGLTAVEL